MSAVDLSKAKVGDKGRARCGRIGRVTRVSLGQPEYFDWDIEGCSTTSGEDGTIGNEPNDFDIVEFPLKPEPSELEPFDLERAKAGEPIQHELDKPLIFVGCHENKIVCIYKDEPSYYYAQHLRMAPKPKRKFWVNVYEGMTSGTREDADKHASSKRIACIEVEEGEGL